LIDLCPDLIYSLVNSVVDPFLCILGRVEVLPKDRFGNCCLYTTPDGVAYLLLPIRRYVVRVLRVLPDILGLVLDVDLEVVLVIGVVYRHLDYPSASLDSSDLLAWRRPLSILLRTTAVLFEVSCLATVIASGAGLVLTRTEVPLVGVYVYGPLIVPVGRAGVLAFAAIVGFRVGRRE
jgi:hypothetical protein